jgi:2-amino-4-hydroxy-6-hydroxymethyldihydropteridine diphosphokinase
MTNKAVIGLGSNIDPQANIVRAVDILKTKFFVLAQSKFVRTKPIGPCGQEDFINGAVLIETHLDLYELRAFLKHLETEMGRKRDNNPFSSRVIDLDLTVWNGQVLDKDFYERDFLKKATLELVPDLKY